MEEKILLENCEKNTSKYAHLKTAQKRREYNHKFYENNKDKDIKRSCDICLGSYTIFNKSHHNKSKKHLKAIYLKENPIPAIQANPAPNKKYEEITFEEGQTRLESYRKSIKQYQKLERELDFALEIFYIKKLEEKEIQVIEPEPEKTEIEPEVEYTCDYMFTMPRMTLGELRAICRASKSKDADSETEGII